MNNFSASEEYERMLMEERRNIIYHMPKERQVSKLTIDKRRKAAKQARKQRKRNRL